MRQFSERLRRGASLCFLGAVFLLVLVAVPIGPPTATAVEDGENVTVYRASNVSFESTETIEAAIVNGTVEPADRVAVGDTLVVVIESERLADTMNASNGTTTTRFFAALDGDAEFRIVQTNPTPNANRKRASIGPENVTVHRNETTVYALVETGNLTVRYRRVHREAQIFGGERFAVQFGYDLPDGWSLGTTPSTPIIEFHQTTEQSATTEQPSTTATSAPTSYETATSEKETSTSETPSTTSEQANTTEVGGGQTDAPGVPGFTVPTLLVALVLLIGFGTRYS